MTLKRWGEELVVLRREHPTSIDVLNQIREDAPIKVRKLKGNEQ